MSEQQTTNTTQESFEDLLNKTSFASVDMIGKVVKGVVLNVTDDYVLVDVGLKSEGRVPIKEFGHTKEKPQLNKYDEVEVYIERMEDRDGLIVLSHEKARREAAWRDLERAHEKEEPVPGVMFGRVKGGFTVDLQGAVAFLPGSQLDVRPIKDVDALMNIEQPFMILKMDRSRGNIVVSRRAVLEESRSEQRDEVLSKIDEGVVIEGLVKNITDYGAFIDLGGVDGLLHITDMSWSRLNHPSEMIQLGETIKVQVIRYNRDTGRVSLGMKQLEADPWADLTSRLQIGDRINGKITNIADYGAFVEIEPGVEGLIHVSEMSWTKKNVHPGKLLSTHQEVEAVILEIDSTKRRIALGLKQASENPWDKIVDTYPAGTVFEGTVRNITEFGLFVSVTDDIDGMVHMSDLSWDVSPDEAIQSYEVGQKVKAIITEIDPEKERIALSIKALVEDPFMTALGGLKRGDTVTCEITKVTDAGLDVLVKGSVGGFIRKVDLGRTRADQRPDRFAVGERVDARVTNIDRKNRALALSVKAREIAEEKEAMETYGSTDSGASLGDILGAALNKANISTEASKETAKKAVSSVKEEVASAAETTKETVEKAVETSKKAAEGGKNKAKENLENTATGAKESFQHAVTEAKEMAESVIEAAEESVEEAKKSASDTKDKAVSATKAAAQDVAEAVEEKAEEAKASVKKAVQSSTTGTKSTKGAVTSDESDQSSSTTEENK